MFRLRRPRRSAGYPEGSCTRYAYDTLPWVPLRWGDAQQWPESARRAGLVVDKEPAAGCLCVIQTWDLNDRTGHVVVIDDVLDDGRLMINERWSLCTITVTQLMLRTGVPTAYIHPPQDECRRLPDGAV